MALIDDLSRPIEEHRFPCDACGAEMEYHPDSGNLVCPHCGNSETIQATNTFGTAIQEMDFRAAVEKRLPEAEIEETRVTACDGCGAQVEFDSDAHALECPFCATPVVTDTGTHRHIKPRGVLPFVLDEEDARDKMTDWLGRLWFAPGGLQEYARKGRTLSGIYVPYWTFDADTQSTYSGQRGDDYYETKTVTRNGERKEIRVRKTRWRSVRGRVARFFDDILVLASKSLPKRYTDALQPWDLSHLEPYQPEYLAGFRAEGYQIPLQDGFTEARAYMNRVIERDVKFDIGGDRQRIHSLDTDVRDVTFKHILLPVWMAAYKYRGKSYRFVVNGQSGRVQGERPWSVWKIAFAVILGLILAGIAGYLFAVYGGDGGTVTFNAPVF